MKNIAIFGANGFWGLTLCKYLLENEKNINIIAIGRNLNKSRINFCLGNLADKITWCSGDISDYKFVDSVINRYEINDIYNLSAVSVVSTSENSPLRTFETNVQGVWNVLESARHNKRVESVIISSSDKSYGPEKLPYKEDSKLSPKAVYEVSKTCADHLTQVYGANFKVPCVVVRSCNLFGPFDFNFSRIVPNTIIRSLNGERPYIWSGVADYKREVIYSEDSAEYLVRLSEKIKEDKNLYGQPLNLGSGVVYRVEDLINEIAGYIKPGLTAEIREKNFKFDEIPEQYLDLTKVSGVLGTLPNRTKNIEECLLKTINWYKQVKKQLGI